MIRGPLRDALTGAPGAALAGVGRDFAETKQNPSFVAAPVAALGWEYGGAELTGGILGLVIAMTTRNDTWYEATAGLLFAGMADTVANITHYSRNVVNTAAVKASRAGAQTAPQAPSKIIAQVGVVQPSYPTYTPSPEDDLMGVGAA